MASFATLQRLVLLVYIGRWNLRPIRRCAAGVTLTLHSIPYVTVKNWDMYTRMGDSNNGKERHMQLSG
jgi:hypothetical protein